MKPLAPNTLLQNRYLIVQLIGKGGMGEVYLAVDQRLGSAIAIKRTYFTEDDALAGAFEREARTLARLRHPVLPKVSDHFSENDNQYLVMEHISGDDLSRRLETNKKPFPVNWVLFWADQLLDALNYLHSHEPPIIHRDIKPQNLKLTADNQIVLLDFGLAKDSVGQTKITTTGSIVGFTPHYAPMEQIRGTGTNPKSDLYALSATLYQLLTNTVPFDALTRADSLLNGVADPVQPISDLNKEVARPISDIILKGMSVSQEQRHGNAREMQKLLRDAYSAMQNQMAAQTVAFNLQNELKPETPVQEKTIEENFATIINDPSTDSKLDSQSSNLEKTEVLNHSDFLQSESQPNFDATVKMNDVSAFDSKSEKTGEKTEVFLKDDLGVSSEFEADKKSEKDFTPPANVIVPPTGFDSLPKNEPIENVDLKTSDFSEQNKTSPENSDFKTSEEKISDQPDFYKTDYITGENKSTVNKSTENTTSSTVAVADLTQKNFNREEPKPREEFKKTPPPVVNDKKSGGKGLAIGAGLFALLLLLGGASLGGWYMYKNYVAVQQPTPTPELSPSIQTTPEATPEPTLAETNTSNTNTDVAETGNTNSANINAGETNSTLDNTRIATTESPRPAQTVRPTPAPRQTPIISTVTTPRPQSTRKPPVTQKTPTGSRTDIIKQ